MASELLKRLYILASKFRTKWTYWKQNSKKRLRPDSSKLLVVGSNPARGAQKDKELCRCDGL